LGLAKVHNNGELTASSDAVSSITYNVTELSDDGSSMTVQIQYNGANTWQFKFVKVQPPVASLAGRWKFAPIAGAMAVGESSDNLGWWSNSEDDVVTRACIFDDIFVFGDDGSFSQEMGAETWVEGWQTGDGESCATPVAPHDGSFTDGTFTYDGSQLTINGFGAHLGLAKVHNNGELSASADAVSSITYNVTELAEDGNSMTVQIQYNGANTWQFKFVKEAD
jgi:hypothetical protein